MNSQKRHKAASVTVPKKHPSSLFGKVVSPEKSSRKNLFLPKHKKENCTANQNRTFITLGKNEVEQLISVLISISSTGLFLTNKTVMNIIQNYFKLTNQKTASNNMLNRSWVSQFMKANKIRLGEIYISNSRYSDIISLSITKVKSFFIDLEALMKSLGLSMETMLSRENAHRLFNCDSLSLSAINSNGSRGSRNNRYEENLTLNALCCISADGHQLRPHIINNRHWRHGQSHYNTLSSESQAIDTEDFFQWLSVNFLNYLSVNNVQRPVLLFLNGTRQFISYKSFKFASDHGIIFYHFPPYTARLCQPLSVSIFKAVKKEFKQQLQNFIPRRLSNRSLASIFMKAYQSIDIPNLSRNAFQQRGICPLNPAALTNFSLKGGLNNSVEKIIPSVTNNLEAKNGKNMHSNQACAAHESSISKTSVEKILDAQEKNICRPSFAAPIKRVDKKDLCRLQSSLDKFSFKSGYQLALENIEKIFGAIIDPSILNLYKKKYEKKEELPDATFLIWCGLQRLNQIPELIGEL